MNAGSTRYGLVAFGIPVTLLGLGCLANMTAIASGKPLVAFPDDKPTNANSRVRDLQKERVAVLREAVDDIKAAYQAGRTSIDRLQQALRSQYDAELEICDTDKEKLRVHQEIFNLARENEQSTEQRYKSGNVPKIDLLMATASRLSAAIALERVKAKLEVPSK